MQRRWIWIGLGLIGLGLAQTFQLQRHSAVDSDGGAALLLYGVLLLTGAAGAAMLLSHLDLAKLAPSFVRALPRR